MITNLVVFAFITGLFSGAVIVGAITWAKELGLNIKKVEKLAAMSQEDRTKATAQGSRALDNL